MPRLLAQDGSTRENWVVWLDEHSLLVPFRLILLLVVGVFVTYLLRRWVRRAVDGLADLRSKAGLGPSDVERALARRRTMTNVVVSSAVAVIWLTVVLTGLSAVGINMGAFIAGATLIGGAIAFGAQQLVRDLIAGFCVLAEDQYGVGDTVDLGLARGTVEKVTLRSVRLRDADGRVWFVPHGNVSRTANLTNGLAVVNIDLVVPLSADVADVEGTLGRLGSEVVARPPFAAAVEGTGQVLGVERLDDNRVTIRWTAKCRPAEQVGLRRAMQAAVADARRDGRLPAPPASEAAASP